MDANRFLAGLRSGIGNLAGCHLSHALPTVGVTRGAKRVTSSGDVRLLPQPEPFNYDAGHAPTLLGPRREVHREVDPTEQA